MDEVEALKGLMTHVLELDAAEQPSLGAREFDLAPLLERIVKRFRPIALARKVRLSVNPSDVAVAGDALATERILSNLVDNAIKFSSSGGNVDVIARRSAPDVEIEVRDDGVGISDDTRARVFEPFYRADREALGSGLGLAIAIQLAHAQSGALRCESEIGSGSAFILTLPAAPS